MSPSEYVIDALGGLTKVARGLTTDEKRVPVTTVQRWKSSGRIPQDWWKPIMALAESEGIQLTLEDFLNEHPDAEGEERAASEVSA